MQILLSLYIEMCKKLKIITQEFQGETQRLRRLNIVHATILNSRTLIHAINRCGENVLFADVSEETSLNWGFG